MTTAVPPEVRLVAICPACGYPTLGASLCAVCSTMSAGLLPDAELMS